MIVNLFQSIIKSCEINLTTSTSPMDVVGSFLRELFNQEHMQRCIQPMCYRRGFDSNIIHHVSSKPVNFLHSAFGYSQSQLIRLVLGIYGGPPGTFEVLHCKPLTTEQELKLFMERVAHHPRQYLVLEVNHLPYQLQEVGENNICLMMIYHAKYPLLPRFYCNFFCS